MHVFVALSWASVDKLKTYPTDRMALRPRVYIGSSQLLFFYLKFFKTLRYSSVTIHDPSRKKYQLQVSIINYKFISHEVFAGHQCQTISKLFICDPWLLSHKYLSPLFIDAFAGYHCQNSATCDPWILPQKYPSSHVSFHWRFLVDFFCVLCVHFFFLNQVHDILQGRHCACLEAATWRPLSSLFSFNSSNQHYVSKYSTSTRASSPIASVLSWARGRGPKGYYYASGRNPCVRRIA